MSVTNDYADMDVFRGVSSSILQMKEPVAEWLKWHVYVTLLGQTRYYTTLSLTRELRKHCSKEWYLWVLSFFKQKKLGGRRNHLIRELFLTFCCSLLYPKHRNRRSLKFLYLSEGISSERRRGISLCSHRTLRERQGVTEGQRLKAGGLHRHSSHPLWESIQ